MINQKHIKKFQTPEYWLILAICLSFMLLIFGIVHKAQTASAACAAPSTSFGTDTLSINVPADGNYRIWSRLRTPDTNNNSYDLVVDGGCPITVGDGNIPATTWTWVDYQNGVAASKIDLPLTSGTHTFQLVGREPGVRIDRVILTQDTACMPTGTGNNCVAPPPDTTPSDTTITANPAASTTNTTASFSFTSSEASSTFQCKLDNASYTTCTNPQAYSSLALGSHTFSVRATDSSGNQDTTPAIYTWTVIASPDTTPPTIPTNLKAVAPSSATVSLTWTASTDSGGSGLAGYNIYRNNTKLNPNPVTALTYSDTTVSTSTSYSYKIEAVDQASNKSAQTTAVNVTTPAKPAGKRGDITGPAGSRDGKIDIFDLSYLIRNYNTTNLNADITGSSGNTDGKVDIFDLSYIIRNYGG